MNTTSPNLDLFGTLLPVPQPEKPLLQKRKRTEVGWSPWHGCQKISPGCKHCYVYRIDARHERNSREVKLTQSFKLPVQKKRDGSYRIESGTQVATCFSSDFFVEEADLWRHEAWAMIRERSDLSFFMITKRIHRFHESLPEDWGRGYANVTIGCTVENQEMAEKRLPLFKNAPIRRKMIICAPLLEKLDLSVYLDKSIRQVVVSGESGLEARACDYDWILSLREQCRAANVSFLFRQTGARLIKDGKLYRIRRALQFSQARKAKINLHPTYR